MPKDDKKTQRLFEMATTLPFAEVRDERGEDSVPELVRVAELRDMGNLQEAIDYGKALIKMYPDYDLIPFMIAYIYYQKEYPKEAMQVALDAIPRCPRKYRLYSVAGLAEFDRNNLPEAIVWWSRSVLAQSSIQDFQEYDPFMHLGHAATVVGKKHESELMFTMTDAIAPEKPRLSPDFVDKLLPLRSHWANDTLKKVLSELANHLQ